MFLFEKRALKELKILRTFSGKKELKNDCHWREVSPLTAFLKINCNIYIRPCLKQLEILIPI